MTKAVSKNKDNMALIAELVPTFLLISYIYDVEWAFRVAQLVKTLPVMQETWVQSLGWEDSLGKGKSIHSIFWPGEFPGLYRPWGHKESNTTWRLSMHT